MQHAVYSHRTACIVQVVVLALFVIPAHARTYYNVTPITKSLNGGNALAFNDLGQITGERVLPTGGSASRGFFYDGRAVTNFSTLGGENSSGRAVNLRGQVVGVSTNAAGDTRPFRWNAGTMIQLPLPEGSNIGVANDINANGQSVGRTTSRLGQQAILWNTEGYTLLPSLGGSITWANAINDGGDIAGYSYAVDFTPPHAFLYSESTIVDLGTADGKGSSAADINNRREIVGYIDYPNSVRHAMYYLNGRMIDIGTLGGPFAAAVAINDSGTAIGDSYSLPTGRVRSFVWHDGLMLDINSLVAPEVAAAITFTTAIAINNRGELICSGSSSNPSFPNGEYLFTPVEGESQLINFSVRGRAGSGEETLIAGFITAGPASKSVLIRGIGPALAPYGVSAPAQNPNLVLFGSNGEFAQNDDWNGSSDIAAVTKAVGAFALPPGSCDASLQTQLPAGAYTAILSAPAPSGVALTELYAIDSAAPFKNVSGRVESGLGEETAIAGFVIQGTAPKTLLIRATGPSLAKYGVTAFLADPRLTIFSNGTIITSNDDWSDTPMLPSIQTATSRVGAFPLEIGSKDAAVLVTLPAGAYTVHATGPNEVGGVVLIEVYDVL